MPGALSTLPLESATVTASGVMFGMLDATRCTIACTVSLETFVPPAGCTSTAALGSSAVAPANTWSGGIVRFTVAAATPSIASIVFSSSPCIARW